ncbi:hypothetical protein PODOV006v2_p0050 [Vibrio phage 15E36.1]|uniref:Holin n=1 Tax=Vibrio phage 15E36.1 TaxID=2859290 RepID=A0AAE8C8N5_9CAUD|nr:hypothetical protein PODOV006v2_p0050 [Vibrio phage 15E36.1]
MNKSDLASQVADMTVKAAPPVTVTGLTFYGVALPDVVAILTIVYLVVHIGYIVTKWFKGR